MSAKSSKIFDYHKDFYAWALQNAELIRHKQFTKIDVEHVAEELESMGRSDRRELIHRFSLLLAHLLKWQFQPERRGNSWKYTIKEQRFEVRDLLQDSPSLNHELEDQIEHAYQKALLIAVKETGLNIDTFPKSCPFSLSQTLNSDFLPDHQ